MLIQSTFRSNRPTRTVGAAAFATRLVQWMMSRRRTATFSTATEFDPWWDDLGIDDDIDDGATAASVAAWRQRAVRTTLPAS